MPILGIEQKKARRAMRKKMEANKVVKLRASIKAADTIDKVLDDLVKQVRTAYINGRRNLQGTAYCSLEVLGFSQEQIDEITNLTEPEAQECDWIIRYVILMSAIIHDMLRKKYDDQTDFMLFVDVLYKPFIHGEICIENVKRP